MPRPHRTLRPVLAGTVAWLAAAVALAADGENLVVLADAGVVAADLACPANGQMVYCLDAQTGGIVAVDPLEPRTVRAVVGACPEDGPRPLAIACIDTNTLAAVCRAGAAWSLRTWRLRPDAAVEFAAPLQEAPVGTGAASDGPVHLLAGISRDWLALAGLPAPLPPLMRAAIAGVRVGRLSDHGCPSAPEAGQVVAIAASPPDDLVLVVGGGAARLAVHGLAGRLLLDLECRLPNVRDAACCRTDGTLWAIGGDRGIAAWPEGLWRLDAGLEDGRQVVRPTCVARLADPRAVTCVSNSAVVVAHGDGGRRLVRLDLLPRKPAARAAAAEGDGP